MSGEQSEDIVASKIPKIGLPKLKPEDKNKVYGLIGVILILALIYAYYMGMPTLGAVAGFVLVAGAGYVFYKKDKKDKKETN